jgi:hypothetical protein
VSKEEQLKWELRSRDVEMKIDRYQKKCFIVMYLLDPGAPEESDFVRISTQLVDGNMKQNQYSLTAGANTC